MINIIYNSHNCWSKSDCEQNGIHWLNKATSYSTANCSKIGISCTPSILKDKNPSSSTR